MNLLITRRLLKLDRESVASRTGISLSSLERIESTPTHSLLPFTEVRILCCFYSEVLCLNPDKLLMMLAQGNYTGFKINLCKRINNLYSFIGGIFLDGTKKV